jgi:hypothetical protein
VEEEEEEGEGEGRVVAVAWLMADVVKEEK